MICRIHQNKNNKRTLNFCQIQIVLHQHENYNLVLTAFTIHFIHKKYFCEIPYLWEKYLLSQKIDKINLKGIDKALFFYYIRFAN